MTSARARRNVGSHGSLGSFIGPCGPRRPVCWREAWRRAGLAGALLGALAAGRPAGAAMEALVGVAERDVVEPLPVETRIAIARRLLGRAGFAIRAVSPDVARDDPWAIAGRLEPG
ncbi:MAG: hypothetical protein A2V85_06375 [Chloroflexi bacterium RBG_16_72_14]|nr:MAG: hypothetical protein A2V85_06375 [Chloroflexi bacterium RBG_16_72_14]